MRTGVKRNEQLMQLDIDIKRQRDTLTKLKTESYSMDDDAKYKSKKSREKKIGRPAKAKVVHEPKG